MCPEFNWRALHTPEETSQQGMQNGQVKGLLDRFRFGRHEDVGRGV